MSSPDEYASASGGGSGSSASQALEETIQTNAIRRLFWSYQLNPSKVCTVAGTLVAQMSPKLDFKAISKIVCFNLGPFATGGLKEGDAGWPLDLKPIHRESHDMKLARYHDALTRDACRILATVGDAAAALQAIYRHNEVVELACSDTASDDGLRHARYNVNRVHVHFCDARYGAPELAMLEGRIPLRRPETHAHRPPVYDLSASVEVLEGVRRIDRHTVVYVAEPGAALLSLAALLGMPEAMKPAALVWNAVDSADHEAHGYVKMPGRPPVGDGVQTTDDRLAQYVPNASVLYVRADVLAA
ncbi:hypothetical protein B0T26DRAFT_757984 [Lasiosphaeria miniovina]|uniref:Uncharacterized protein n=1 Tax=Lasiosphaeria miniovina TaxID=1954250 RepID=A0AA39ZR08_9PEZI|nr:uncharacterized protein B0T26DRAFT_757984 [Lasiosphaeria miniovina]KAK0702023.1 hypothetical protein B0T26DRAFT_757984 [Lasiosphaeria miniovina]